MVLSPPALKPELHRAQKSMRCFRIRPGCSQKRPQAGLPEKHANVSNVLFDCINESRVITPPSADTIGPNSRLVLYQRHFYGPGMLVEDSVLRATPAPLSADELAEEVIIDLQLQAKVFISGITVTHVVQRQLLLLTNPCPRSSMRTEQAMYLAIEFETGMVEATTLIMILEGGKCLCIWECS